ncbi:hypothetical protein AN958_12294 [Leucoagaricus sp. SymC.cos]|nr:hypothetical protein AN958_12294 [Leucoagaricus sp. SymC.cos]
MAPINAYSNAHKNNDKLVPPVVRYCPQRRALPAVRWQPVRFARSSRSSVCETASTGRREPKALSVAHPEP